LGDDASYRVLIGSIEDGRTHPISAKNCARLEEHLAVASTVCPNFHELLKEKASLPPHLHEANRTVLNKLAEIRAVVGLHEFGFSDIRFTGRPDLSCTAGGSTLWVEVTRLGASQGKRSLVYDEAWETKDGEIFVGTMTSDGAVEDAIGEAVYREVEDKHRQLRDVGDGKSALWISLGNDYFVNSTYSLPSMSLLSSFRQVPAKILQDTWESLRRTGSYRKLNHIVLAGGDAVPLAWPPL
jgi:hypothetical protein